MDRLKAPVGVNIGGSDLHCLLRMVPRMGCVSPKCGDFGN
jgi:hypothetical protein